MIPESACEPLSLAQTFNTYLLHSYKFLKTVLASVGSAEDMATMFLSYWKLQGCQYFLILLSFPFLFLLLCS